VNFGPGFSSCLGSARGKKRNGKQEETREKEVKEKRKEITGEIQPCLSGTKDLRGMGKIGNNEVRVPSL